MKQEDKELLLKDLCTRIPYNTIVHLNLDWGQKWQVDAHISKDIDDIFYILETQPERVKPYLRPMSSMTEEERKDMSKIVTTVYDGKVVDDDFVNVIKYIDWLNALHFDYRGLIEKGLAIEASKENNPYK